MNKKNGNIKSVGVKPCHVACNKGGYTALQVPGVFTKIINAMVKPLKISTDSILFLCMLLYFFQAHFMTPKSIIEYNKITR
jgi:hypothetical protein